MLIPLLIQFIAYQIIKVNSTQPCFLNDTAGIDVWHNCGMDTDYLKAITLGWEWITGGYFSFLLVSIIVLAVYIKYQKVIYPVLVGFVFLPVSYYVFPATFFSFAVIMAFVAMGTLVWYAFISQTNET